MILNFMRYLRNELERAIWQFVNIENKLTSVSYASILFLR